VSETTFDEGYYAAVYPDYTKQNPPNKMRFYRGLVEAAMPKGVVRPKVYDLGCAFGVFLASLPDTWEKFGSDASAFAIDRARTQHASVTFDYTPDRLAAEAGTFDVVTAFDVLEHIETLDDALGLLHRSLKPGGAVVAVVPVYDGPLGPVVWALDKDPTHVHKKSRQFWLQHLATQWDVVDWVGAVRYMVPRLGYVHVPTRLMRGIAPAIAMTLRKK
jgi:SAM-dependent methyltransferase